MSDTSAPFRTNWGGGGREIAARRTNDFSSIVGINGQIQSNVGVYLNTAALADARFIGARLWRDGLVNGAVQLTQFRRLATAGLKFSFIPDNGGKCPYTVVVPVLTGLADTIQRHTGGAIKWLEGGNEPGNFAITYEGMTGGGQNCSGVNQPWTAIGNFARDFYTAVHADMNLRGVSVATTTQTEDQTDNDGLQYLTIPTPRPPASCFQPGQSTLTPTTSTFTRSTIGR